MTISSRFLSPYLALLSLVTKLMLRSRHTRSARLLLNKPKGPRGLLTLVLHPLLPVIVRLISSYPDLLALQPVLPVLQLSGMTLSAMCRTIMGPPAIMLQYQMMTKTITLTSYILFRQGDPSKDYHSLLNAPAATSWLRQARRSASSMTFGIFLPSFCFIYSNIILFQLQGTMSSPSPCEMRAVSSAEPRTWKMPKPSGTKLVLRRF